MHRIIITCSGRLMTFIVVAVSGGLPKLASLCSNLKQLSVVTNPDSSYPFFYNPDFWALQGGREMFTGLISDYELADLLLEHQSEGSAGSIVTSVD